MCVWRTLGYYMVLFLAALKGISKDYYEAASIDGAGKVASFFKITLPMLTPTIFFALCTCLIDAFQMFNEVFILTDGGPARSTQTLVYKIYRLAFTELKMGTAAVWAWALFVIILAVTLVQFKFQKKWVNYDA